MQANSRPVRFRRAGPRLPIHGDKLHRHLPHCQLTPAAKVSAARLAALMRRCPLTAMAVCICSLHVSDGGCLRHANWTTGDFACASKCSRMQHARADIMEELDLGNTSDFWPFT